MPRARSRVAPHKTRPREPSFAVGEEGASGHRAERWAPRDGGGEGPLVKGTWSWGGGYLESVLGSGETVNLVKQSPLVLYLEPATPTHSAWAGGLLRTRQVTRDVVRGKTGQTTPSLIL